MHTCGTVATQSWSKSELTASADGPRKTQLTTGFWWFGYLQNCNKDGMLVCTTPPDPLIMRYWIVLLAFWSRGRKLWGPAGVLRIQWRAERDGEIPVAPDSHFIKNLTSIHGLVLKDNNVLGGGGIPWRSLIRVDTGHPRVSAGQCGQCAHTRNTLAVGNERGQATAHKHSQIKKQTTKWNLKISMFVTRGILKCTHWDHYRCHGVCSLYRDSPFVIYGMIVQHLWMFLRANVVILTTQTE